MPVIAIAVDCQSDTLTQNLRQLSWGKAFKQTIAEIRASIMKRLSKVESADDPTDGANEEWSTSENSRGISLASGDWSRHQ